MTRLGPVTVTDRDSVRAIDLAGAGGRKRSLFGGAAAVLLTLGMGCGLISSDVTKVTFALPPRAYRFDTQQVDWKTSGTSPLASGIVPSVNCAADADCCLGPLALLGIACGPPTTPNMPAILCDAPSSTCALSVLFDAPPQSIDLKQSVPASLSSQSVIDITVSEISYDVTENSLNVDLPPVQLFIAADGAQSPDDPSAVLFGTVPSIPKTKTSTGSAVKLEAGAKDAFINIGHHLGTPFTFLARSRIVVPGGTPVPSGAIGLTINGKLSAQPGL